MTTLGKLLDTLPCCWPMLVLIGGLLGIMWMRCAWCGKVMKPKRSKDVRGRGDGMCDGCREEMDRDADRIAEEYRQ